MTRIDRTEAAALEETLRDTFGVAQLREGQEDVIARVLQGQDTLAIMPTGAGKSLCYQLPALHLPGTTVVVSPLIALMKDQTDRLHKAGIDATQVNSTLTDRDERQALAGISDRRSDLVFATPERLSDPEFITALTANRIDLFVIDEAHCISQWGHDFRPAYLEISNAIDALHRPPLLALTATATPAVIEDIRRQLKARDMQVINTGIYRENLHYQVIHITNDEEKRQHLVTTVRRAGGSVIVYCSTIRGASEAHGTLQAAGIDALLYHGKLGAKARGHSQEAFMNQPDAVIVATNAFGMGIDKGDVRSVVHYQLPGSLESYYQESGRAGRDGLAATCVLLFDPRDSRVQRFFLVRRYPQGADLQLVVEALIALQAEKIPVTLDAIRDTAPGIAVNKIRVTLRILTEAGFVSQDVQQRWQLHARVLDPEVLNSLLQNYRERSEEDQRKLERMLAYAQSGVCRWRQLVEYFGERVGWDRCGVCDNCQRPRTRPDAAAARVRQSTVIPTPAEPLFATGDAVRLPRYGSGVVAEIAGQQVRVEFPDGKTRTFMSSFVQLSE